MYTRPQHVRKHQPKFEMPDDRTLGERWHEEVENENPIIAGLAFTACFTLILAIIVIVGGSQPAYADQLTSGVKQEVMSLKTQASDKSVTKDKYVMHIAKLRSSYSSELTSSEKKQLVKLIVKAADGSKATAKKCSAKADKVAARAKTVKRLKTSRTAAIKADLKALRSGLKKVERSRINSIIASLGKARTVEKVNRFYGDAQVIFSMGKLRIEYGATGWSDAKLMYVSEWGPRVDLYLSGTPMAGTGTMIARVAYDHGMDARLYPAISYVESKCGAAPYGNAYNVCGWVWNPPTMYGWEDACVKWHDYFQSYFGDEWYPISSMHGYGGYGPSYVNEQMARI